MVGVNFGVWNSLHTGLAGSSGPTGRLWYESDFYSTLALEVGDGVTVGTTYTAYTSPNSSFSAVKELSFRVGTRDGLAPYGLIAFELDTRPGLGQADGGQNAGTYLEPAARPSGIPFVILAGTVVVEDGEFTGGRHGSALQAGGLERRTKSRRDFFGMHDDGPRAG